MWSLFCKDTQLVLSQEEREQREKLKVKKWRSRRWNRKCAFCKHCNITPAFLGFSAPDWCRAKNKCVNSCWPRWFCSLYCEKEVK